jgi:hypothetical protein
MAAAALLALPATAAGVPRWTTARDVPGSAGAGFPFDVAVAPGAAAVAMVRDGVRVAIRDRRGRWSPAEAVSRGRTGVTAPDVEVTAGGEVIVAWTQSAARRTAPLRGINEIRVAIRDRRGRWTRPVAVGETLNFIAADVRLAANARGDAAVLWRGQASGDRSRDVLRLASRRAGGRFGRGASLGEPGIDARLAVDRSGRVFAAWTRTVPPEHLRSEIRFAAGDVARGLTAETVHRDRAGGPKLALTPGGSVVLAWRSDERGLGATRTGRVMAAVRSPAGSWAPPQLLSEVTTDEVQLGASDAGEVLLAWAPTPTTEGARAEVAFYSTTRPPAPEFAPVTGVPAIHLGPLGVLADGTAVTVAGGAGIEAAVRPPGGAFAPVRRLARVGDFPALAAAGSTAVAAWLARGRLRAAAFE